MSGEHDDTLGSAIGGASGGVDVTTGRTSGPPSWKGRMVGHFKLLSILGQGAMGKVFRAEDVSLKRHVALKVMPQKVVQGQKTYKLDQFYREARSAATLEHPHVVTIFEVNQTSGVYYIAMELIEGGNLDDIVKASGALDPVRACQLCAEAAEALYYGHQHGIIHRDVKPSNLMLTRGGRCKLMDFGLAHLDDPNDPFNLPTEAVGTPQYVAPEVAQSHPATALSDVYSLGATLYFLLVGRPPYVAGSKKELLKMHVSAPVPDLTRDRPDLPESLAKVISTAMAKDPGERYVSADQFAKVLRTYTIPVGSMSGVHLSGSGALVSGSQSAALGQSPPAMPGGAAVAGSAVGSHSGQMSGSMGMSGGLGGQTSGNLSGVVVDPAAQRRRNLVLIGASVAVGILCTCAIIAVVTLRSGMGGGGGNGGGYAAAPAQSPAPAVQGNPVAKKAAAAAEIPVVAEGQGGEAATAQHVAQTQQSEPALATGPDYVVQGGETLYNIAKRRLGAGGDFHKIEEVNPGLTPATLQKGMTIHLPAGASATDLPGTAAAAEAAGAGATDAKTQAGGGGAAGAAGAAADGGGKVYTPDDTDALAALGGDRHSPEVVVEGTVAKAETSSTGKVTRVELAGTGENKFEVVYFPGQFADMEKAFGGANGTGLAGKKVRVKGKVEMYRDTPQIVLRSAGQVTVVEGKGE